MRVGTKKPDRAIKSSLKDFKKPLPSSASRFRSLEGAPGSPRKSQKEGQGDQGEV